jgi:hypothetical protein
VEAAFEVEDASWDPGSGPQPIQQLFDDGLMNLHNLVDVESSGWVGLGFVDHDGHGLQTLLPLREAKAGRLLRAGNLEGIDSTFPLTEAVRLTRGAHKFSLKIQDGRVVLLLDQQVLVDELAGFPMRFKGTPALVCQNAKCTFKSVKYSL